MADTGHPAESLEPYRSAIAIREEISDDDPNLVRSQSDCAGSWHRLGEALENLERTAEAVEAYQKCVAHQRQVCAREPGEIKHQKFLDERLRQLYWLLLGLGRPAEAVNIARERKALRPDDPAVALGIAGDLAAAAGPKGVSLFPIFRNRERRRYAFEALAAARDAARLMAGHSLVARSGP